MSETQEEKPAQVAEVKVPEPLATDLDGLKSLIDRLGPALNEVAELKHAHVCKHAEGYLKAAGNEEVRKQSAKLVAAKDALALEQAEARVTVLKYLIEGAIFIARGGR